MFLLSLCKHPHSARLPDAPLDLAVTSWSQAQFRVSGWSIVTWTDALLSTLCSTPDRFHFAESVPRSGAGPRQALLTIETVEREPLVRLHRSANGGRPVFYHAAADGSMVFSSHLALLRAWGVPIIERAGILPELYTYRQVCPPFTLLENISQLVAGDRAEVELTGGKWKLFRNPSYMPPAVQPQLLAGAKDPALIADMRHRLETAILAPGVDGASSGCLLSGGLDSSVITSVLARHLNVRETASAVYPFEDLASDTEYRYATTAADSLGTRHVVHTPTMAEYLHGTIDAVALAEEPVMHLQSVLIHLIFKDVLRQRGSKVVPCGEGADGMFGGRLQRLLTTFAAKPHLHLALQLPGVASLLRQISARTNRWGLIAQVADKNCSPIGSFADPNHVIWTLAVFGDRQWIKQHLGCNDAEMIGGRAECMIPYLGRDLRDCASILALLSESSETQVIWSKLGEASGMCVTYPYLDTQVSDLTYSIPWEAKLAGAKPLLRAVARDMGVAEQIVSRPKASFDINPHRWGPRGGVFEPLIDLALPVVDESTLRSLQSTYVFRAHTLWTVLNYALWVRLIVRNQSPQILHDELDASMEKAGVAKLYRARGRIDTRTGSGTGAEA